MLKLLKNELKKIINKKSFVVFLLIIFAIITLTNYLISKNSYNENYYEEAIENLELVNNQIDLYGQNDELLSQKLTYEYVIENNIDIISENNFSAAFSSYFLYFGQFILIFLIIISGNILSNEFNEGTIKSLMILPKKRYQILVSKFIALIIFSLLIFIITVIFNFISCSIFFDIKDINIPILIYDSINKILIKEHVIIYLIKQITTFFPTIMILSLFSFGASVIFTNGVISSTISLMTFLFSESINSLIINNNISNLKFLITLNWDFTYYLYNGVNSYEIITLGYSVFVYITTFVIISVIVILIFNKKNICNQ